MYICQFKKATKCIFILLLLVAVGCATKKIILPTKKITADWFNGPGYSYKDFEGNAIGHMFFDFSPEINMKKRLVDVVITTPKDSKGNFEIDLVSGRLYKERSFCAEKDIWESYPSKIERPNFSMAIIPRLLTSNGKPQRVAVFGDLKYLVDGKFPTEQSVQVQVIGSYVLRYCLSGICDLKTDWQSEVILVAKSMLDESLSSVQGLNSLKKHVDWNYFKAFLENAYGRNEIGRVSRGAFRLESPSLPTRSLNYVLNTGHLFTKSELNTLRRSCSVVYKEATDIFKTKKGLAKRFSDFYAAKWSKFSICRKYVRPFDITKNRKMHWQMEYLRSFSLATDMGFYYNCNSSNWSKNIRRSDGSLAVSQMNELVGCKDSGINDSFLKAIALLVSTSISGTPYYRYIEYDSGADTYNQKIYNWVWNNGKRQSCSKMSTSKPKLIFPSDVRLEFGK